MTDRKGDGMLTVIARAMTAAADQDTGGWIVDDRHGLYAIRIDGTVDMLAVARAALMAMREPGSAVSLEEFAPFSFEDEATWTAMIDAILTESDTPCPTAAHTVG